MDQMKTKDELQQKAPASSQAVMEQPAEVSDYLAAEEAFEQKEPASQKKEQAENEKKYGKSVALPVAEHGGQGLVLGGGGAKGCYHVGALAAFAQMKKHFDAVSGTSIGALVGFFCVQENLEGLTEFVMSMKPTNIARELPSLPTTFKEKVVGAKTVLEFVTKYAEDKMDITPLRERFAAMCSYDQFMSSPMGYACMTFNDTSHQGQAFYKKDFTRELCEDIVMASAACYPAFPKVIMNGEVFMDGGYADNVPVSLMNTMLPDPEGITIIDIHDPSEPILPGLKPGMTYLQPLLHPGNSLDFTRHHALQLYRQGYLEMMKYYDQMPGYLYTFTDRNWQEIQVVEQYLTNQMEQNRVVLPSSDTISDDIIAAMLGYTPRPLKNRYSSHYEYGKLVEGLALLAKMDPYVLYEYPDFLRELKNRLNELKLTATDDRDYKAVEVLSNLKREQLAILLHRYLLKNNGVFPAYIEAVKDKMSVSYALALIWYYMELLIDNLPEQTSEKPKSTPSASSAAAENPDAPQELETPLPQMPDGKTS